MYCQRHRPTPPPGYGGIAFGVSSPPVPPEKTANKEVKEVREVREVREIEEKEEAAPVMRLPVPPVPKKEKTEETGSEPLFTVLLREKWSLEDLITVIALLLIMSGQADDGILLLVGLLLLIDGEGSL